MESLIKDQSDDLVEVKLYVDETSTIVKTAEQGPTGPQGIQGIQGEPGEISNVEDLQLVQMNDVDATTLEAGGIPIYNTNRQKFVISDLLVEQIINAGQY